MYRYLWTPLALGPVTARNRIVFSAHLTNYARDGRPTEQHAAYYAARAAGGAGLIITEGTSPSPNGLGYARIPGLFNAAQVAGWKTITDAVHAAGGRIVVQIMHTGRVSHVANLPAGAQVFGPTDISCPGEIHTDSLGAQPHSPPKAMQEADIQAVIAEYAHCARLAMQAGFDGIELHAANGYLLEQFLQSRTNRRTDAYGGSIENRCRLVLEIRPAILHTKATAVQWLEGAAQRRGLWRAGSGEEPLRLYFGDDEHIGSDTVFGVSQSLVVQAVDDPDAPIRGLKAVRYDFRLARDAEGVSGRVGADPATV